MLWHRATVACARAWGIPPGEVARRADAGEVSGADVFEALLLEMADPLRGAGIHRWLFREREAEREAMVERAQHLVDSIQATTDEVQRKALIEELGRIGKRGPGDGG